METMKSDIHKNFEKFMVNDLDNFEWNEKLDFYTDPTTQLCWAHDVPFYGTVQLDRIEEHGLVEWDIYFNECWQGPFNTKNKAIQHLEECIREEQQQLPFI